MATPASKLSDTHGSEWSSFAANWTRDVKTNPTGAPNAALVARCNELLPFSKATTILDVGCGPGEIFDILLTKYAGDIPKSAQLKATDFAEGMVEGARKKKDTRVQEQTPRGELWKRVDAKQGDAADLKEFEDGSLSHITGGFVYFFLPEPSKGLVEGFKKLQSGGVLGLTSWKESSWMTAMQSGKDIYPDRSWAAFPEDWSSLHPIKKQFEDAGFVDIHTEEATAYWSYDSHNDVAKTMSSIPTVKKSMEGASDEEWAKYVEHMKANLKSVSPEEPGRLTGTALVVVGRKP